MSGLRELYQQVILDHSKNPRNFKVLEGANRIGEGFNPLCGDKVKLYALVEDGVVKDISFEGSGCAISTASCSILTQWLKGKSEREFEELFDTFHDLCTKGQVKDESSLGKLSVFGGVSEFPSRVKCATLCWHTLKNALAGDQEAARTE